jgi:hypothetical protein
MSEKGNLYKQTSSIELLKKFVWIGKRVLETGFEPVNAYTNRS